MWRRISWSKKDLKVDTLIANDDDAAAANTPGDAITPPISPTTVVATGEDVDPFSRSSEPSKLGSRDGSVSKARFQTAPSNNMTPPVTPDKPLLSGEDGNGGEGGESESESEAKAESSPSEMSGGFKLRGSSGLNVHIDTDTRASANAHADPATPHSPTDTTAPPSPITVLYSPLTNASASPPVTIIHSPLPCASNCDARGDSRVDVCGSSTAAAAGPRAGAGGYRRRVEPHIRAIVEGRDVEDWTGKCVGGVRESGDAGADGDADGNEKRKMSWHVEDVEVGETEELEEEKQRSGSGRGMSMSRGMGMGEKRLSFWKGKGKDKGYVMVVDNEAGNGGESSGGGAGSGGGGGSGSRSGSKSSPSPVGEGIFNEGFSWQPRQMMSGKGKEKEKGKDHQRSKSDGEILKGAEGERENHNEKRRRTWASLSRIPNFRKASVVETPTTGLHGEGGVGESEAQRCERERSERERRNMERRAKWPHAELDEHKDEFADQGEYISGFMEEVIAADPNKDKAEAKERNPSKFSFMPRGLSKRIN
ncbi:hypothetical protein DSL72_004536 [Monilinia vaccinii-corymbosi]|uniref:Uncharacterized protein n=1 Tax=Monilinia vaccinii-corymbosi TaxID=61207 RepID=A0A8A3P7K3_9HELO|nr:hypothetical protein DSL72_004536 [Monilinia vaccinii-corymbosi]